MSDAFDARKAIATARAKVTHDDGRFVAAARAHANGRMSEDLTALKDQRDTSRRQLAALEAEFPEAAHPEEPVEVVTVEQAVAAIARAGKFRPTDVAQGHAAAARIRMSVALGPDLRRRLYRLLAGYRDVLAALTPPIAFDAIDPPAESVAESHRPAARPIVGRSKVWLNDKGLWLQSPYTARELVKEQIPAARWQKAAVAYLLPATPQAALAIANALGQYGIDSDAGATELVLAAHRATSAGALRIRDDLPAVPDSKTEAWGHQRQAFWFAREMPGAILDMEMGTGKSKVVVDLVHDSRAESTLIVCPERVVGVWPKQFGLHSGGEKHIVDPRRQNNKGEWNLLPIKDRVALYEHALHECRCGLPHVLISNYSAAAHEPFKSWSVAQRLDYVVYDECHRLRSHGGVWSKWGAKMHKRAERRLGGTGTMQTQTPLDVFGQFRAVEPGVFGATWTGFQKRYAVMGGFEGRKVVDLQNEDELAEKISSIVYRAGEEVLDLPEMLPEVTVTGRLSPRAMKAYKALESEMFAEITRTLADGSTVVGEVTADNVLVKILRCQQMTGGALPLDDGTLEVIDEEKARLLLEELEDIDPTQPVVVFARFHHDLDNIAKVAEKLENGKGRRYGELSGRRSDALSADATLADGVQVAGIQIQAGGTGVDFTASKFGIYYSVGHSLGDYLQSRKRLHRPGQINRVRLRHLVMEGTIDEDVYEALAERKSVTDRISEKVRGIQAASGVRGMPRG